MADVQVEDGFTRFAHTLLEALCCADLPARHLRVVLAIGRLTYGYHRTADWIGSAQLANATGIADSHVRLVLRDLIRWNVVFATSEKRGNLRQIGIQKDFDQWAIAREVRTVGGPDADRGRSGRSTVRKRTTGGPDADHRRSDGIDTQVGPPTVRQAGPSTVRGSDHPRSDSIDSLPKISEKKEDPPVSPRSAPEWRLELAPVAGETPRWLVRRAWPAVQAAFAAYDPKRVPKVLTDARRKRAEAIVREFRDRAPGVLVELVHGYMAHHDRHGDDWNPFDNFTPETCWRAIHTGKHIEAHDRALEERGPPPWPPRGRMVNGSRSARSDDSDLLARTREILQRDQERYG